MTNTVWQEITALYCKGLSRVYHLKAQAANLAREDLGTLIPLIAVKGERAAPMIARLCSPAYWRAFGLSAVPADAPDYDPNGHDGPGGMWPEYAALLGLALVAHGKREASAELFMNVLAAQIATLREAGDFRRYYNAETGTGLGALGSLMGAVSWEWFTTLFGAYVVDVHAVQITGPLAFKEHTITWRQHGITVQRSASGTLITFADGKKLKLPAEQRGTFMR